LLDYGFRAIIAPSYADIFYNNCFKNGILPVVLPEETVAEILNRAKVSPGYRVTVDLERPLSKTEQGLSVPFQIDEFRRHCLLNGLDDIAMSLQHVSEINAFEARPTSVETRRDRRCDDGEGLRTYLSPGAFPGLSRF